MSRAVLLIHYYYPPIQSVGIIRNYQLSKCWAEYADKVCLISTKNAEILTQEHLSVPDKIQLFRVSTNDYRSRSRNKNTHYNEETKQSIFKQLGIKLINSFPFIKYIGEGGRTYIKEGVEIGRKFLTENPEAIIYSSFRPYADHLIAYELKKAFPKTKWIADFRDLHLDPMYKHYIFPAFQKRRNKTILAKADLVCTVSQGLARALNNLKTNTVVLSNGVEVLEKKKSEEKFTLSYTGSLFLDERDPGPAMQAIKELIKADKIDPKEIQWVYAGKDGSLFAQHMQRYSLDSIFNNRGMITRKEAREIQQRAHINVLLTSANPDWKGILTGKFYEYLGAGKNILLIIKGCEDEEFTSLFSKYKLGWIYHTDDLDKQDLKNQIYQAYTSWKKNGDIEGLNMEAIENNFSWEANFNKLIDQIES